ncbi:uncharacterized protein ARMOST_03679 [Armillaria ostoyae]|uniref:Cyclin-like domain-containing protein n=1 Tax=Armillaria ostoyae TaxID=47428 RepID=A0A284QV70_ARMOS|nr:uncharacterized protein ARMOST_03679 [Armillaria ostoyae]
MSKDTQASQTSQEASANTSKSQWLFPLETLQSTPSTSSLEKQLYDRARGVEFLYRLGSSLQLPVPAMFTAATWFHRFYMRYSMDDYHRQDVAASCIFLATKTEECGRKLRDVARVCQSKVSGKDVADIPDTSKEVENCQTAILLTEEVLLEALCFDFVVESPHAELVDLFNSHDPDILAQEYAWTIAHDSYRTPLCLLFPPRIIAAACFILAQRVVDGPNSPSLDLRISSTPPSASLPTPPSNKPPSPDRSRFALEYFAFNEAELASLADTLRILIEFYSVQDKTMHPHLSTIATIPAPTITLQRANLYSSFSRLSGVNPAESSHLDTGLGRTPNSSHGGQTPEVNGNSQTPNGKPVDSSS